MINKRNFIPKKQKLVQKIFYLKTPKKPTHGGVLIPISNSGRGFAFFVI